MKADVAVVVVVEEIGVGPDRAVEIDEVDDEDRPVAADLSRDAEPVAFLRVALKPEMAGWFGVEAGAVTYGRLGVIYTGDRPAVEVLEILAPISE